MIAIMLIGVGLTSATVCLRTGMLLQDSARATTYATQVLQDEAESLRLLNWGNIESLAELTTLTPSNILSPEGINPDRFTFERHISSPNGSPELKRILVQASWEGINQKMHYLDLEFLYAKNGMHDYLYGLRP